MSEILWRSEACGESHLIRQQAGTVLEPRAHLYIHQFIMVLIVSLDTPTAECWNVSVCHVNTLTGSQQVHTWLLNYEAYATLQYRPKFTFAAGEMCSSIPNFNFPSRLRQLSRIWKFFSVRASLTRKKISNSTWNPLELIHRYNASCFIN